MKNKLMLTMFFFLVSVSSAQIFDYEGACDNFLCLMPRNPFYTTSQHCTLTITLDYPNVSGSKFYTNTLEINTTTYGGLPPIYCWYTENGLGNISTNQFNCANKTITFPSGTVDLIVYSQDNLGCLASSSSQFEVILFSPTGVGEVKVWPAFALLGFLVLFGTTNYRKKNQRT